MPTHNPSAFSAEISDSGIIVYIYIYILCVLLVDWMRRLAADGLWLRVYVCIGHLRACGPPASCYDSVVVHYIGDWTVSTGVDNKCWQHKWGVCAHTSTHMHYGYSFINGSLALSTVDNYLHIYMRTETVFGVNKFSKTMEHIQIERWLLWHYQSSVRLLLISSSMIY